jgi:hypothetical protein
VECSLKPVVLNAPPAFSGAQFNARRQCAPAALLGGPNCLDVLISAVLNDRRDPEAEALIIKVMGPELEPNGGDRRSEAATDQSRNTKLKCSGDTADYIRARLARDANPRLSELSNAGIGKAAGRFFRATETRRLAAFRLSFLSFFSTAETAPPGAFFPVGKFPAPPFFKARKTYPRPPSPPGRYPSAAPNRHRYGPSRSAAAQPAPAVPTGAMCGSD